MDTSLNSLINLYQIPTGRRIFALTEVATRAKRRGETDLAKHCARALAHDKECLALEYKWAGVATTKSKAASRAPDAPPDLETLDPLVDRTITAIRDHAEGQRAGAAPDDPIHAVVATFMNAAFPTKDVRAITSLASVNQLAAVDNLLRLFATDEIAAAIKELGLRRLTQRLAALQEQYRAALKAPDEATIAFGQVREARIEGQELLLEAVAKVLGRFSGRAAEHVEARDDLLAPILEQNEAVGAALRARRTVTDVNPEDGSPAPAGPDAGPSPAPAKG